MSTIEGNQIPPIKALAPCYVCNYAYIGGYILHNLFYFVVVTNISLHFVEANMSYAYIDIVY